jgi:hypothetical protein
MIKDKCIDVDLEVRGRAITVDFATLTPDVGSAEEIGYEKNNCM